MFHISAYTDNPGAADHVSSSRDCLVPTSTNSSDAGIFYGLLWQAASSLWRRISNGTTSYKSKSE